jgi:YrhK-like protein
VIGHALAFAPRPETRALWDRSIAIGFAIGSTCFLVGPFPGFAQLVGPGADAAVFFAGSIFFTFAALLEARESTVRLGRWASDPSWWSAAVQFLGTLFFNVSTFTAMLDGLSSEQTNKLVWAPDVFGSACFLVSGVLAYQVASGGRLRPATRDRNWTMAAINLLGCVLFGVSAVASFIVPSTGSILDLAAANWTTALGALCFLAGSLMLLAPEEPDRSQGSAASP